MQTQIVNAYTANANQH